MNPPGDADDGGYAGVEPLDRALADRFAWILRVPGWDELSAEERVAVADPRGDDPADDGGLAAAVAEAAERFREGLRSPPAWIPAYVVAVVDALAPSPAALSPRRARQLARNLVALEAVGPTDSRLVARALSASHPGHADLAPPSPALLAAAHRAAWLAVREDRRAAWLLAFTLERDLARKAAMLVSGCPDPETGLAAVAHVIADESATRCLIFAAATYPVLLDRVPCPIGEEALQSLAPLAVRAWENEGPVRMTRIDSATRVQNGGWGQGFAPGFPEAMRELEGRGPEAAARLAPLLEHLVAQHKKLPDDWRETVALAERCRAAVAAATPVPATDDALEVA